MKYKKVLIISSVLTILLFITLAFLTIFRVNDVSVTYSVFQHEDYVKAEEIIESYKGRNIFFVDEGEIAQKITENTNLKINTIKKRYPFTLVLDLYASEERFAIKGEDGYYVLDLDYVVLKTRETELNPADNLTDVVLEFQTTIQPEITLKQPLKYADEALFTALKTTISCFESPRDRLLKVVCIETQEAGNFRIEIYMRSGVKIEIYKATQDTREKVLAAISRYQSIVDGDLLKGTIACYKLDSGEITAVYTMGK